LPGILAAISLAAAVGHNQRIIDSFKPPDNDLNENSMPFFGSGKDKQVDAGSETVLAYLEDAARAKVPYTLFDAKGLTAQGVLSALDVDKKTATFKLSGPLPGGKGSTLSMAFLLDGLRIGGPCTVIETRPGYAELALPDSLALLDRRKRPRARLNVKEGATLTALSGLFEGVGLTGVIENLSECGARIRIERAMEAKGEKKLGIHSSLVAPGHGFDLLKLSKLPRIPGTWECSGKAVYLEGAGGGVALGVAFSGFPQEALGALKSLIAGRVGSIPSSLPAKTRRIREREEDPKPATPVSEAPVKPEPAAQRPQEVPVEAAPKPDLVSEPAAPEAPLPPAAAPAPARNAALIKLKKKSRSVLVALRPSDPDRASLLAFMAQEGYGKILVAETLRELLDHLDEPGLSLILVEGGVEELGGTDLVEFINQVVDTLPPVALALEEISETTVLAAHRLGIGQVKIKPYELDAAFAAGLETLLGL
jgi:hypothetical protein